MADPAAQEKMPEMHGDADDKRVLQYTWVARQQAYEAKRDRMFINRSNWDTFNLIGDFSHKKSGQSQEFLPRQAMAVEQISSFLTQALIDTNGYFEIVKEDKVENPIISADEIFKLTNRQLDKAMIFDFFEDVFKSGLIGSLMIAKVYGEYVPAQRFSTEKKIDNSDGLMKTKLYRIQDKIWQLKLDVIRQEDWFPDPTNNNLYQIQQLEMDLWKVKQLSEGQHAIYDPAIVGMIQGGFEDQEQVARKARETHQNQTFVDFRKRCRIWECYGNICDTTTGDLLHENVTWTVANDRFLISKPKPIPFWHGESPFVVSPIIRVPQSVWHKALMDAPTALNKAMNEIFNLELDRGLMSVWGIRQVRPDWMVDETKYAEGIGPGASIEVNTSCPPGGKVLEPVQTADPNPESMQTFNAVSGEFQQAALTNDLRMGVMPDRQVKATEVAEASQSITSMFTGTSKKIEKNFLDKVIAKSWMTIVQHMNDLDTAAVEALLGKDRATALRSKDNQELFAATAQGFKFQTSGISQILGKMKNFQKIQALLQTIGTSEVLIEEFTKKYDFGQLLEEIMEALDINTARIEIPAEEKAAMASKQGQPQQGGPQPGMPGNPQSQIPQAGSANSAEPSNAGGYQPAGAPAGMPGGTTVPHAHFPPSRATPKAGF